MDLSAGTGTVPAKRPDFEVDRVIVDIGIYQKNLKDQFLEMKAPLNDKHSEK